MWINPASVKWANSQLQTFPKDQTLLFFLLATLRAPSLEYTKDTSKPSGLIAELYKYLGVRLPNGSWRIFNPLEGKWRAENYVYSTILGRLLNGSHWWTADSDKGFLERIPSQGWPARLQLRENAITSLEESPKPPKISPQLRLPLEPLSILYFRYSEIPASITNLSELVAEYRKQALQDAVSAKLVSNGGILYFGDLLSKSAPSDEVLCSYYPSYEDPHVALDGEDAKLAISKTPPGMSTQEFLMSLVRNFK